MNPLSAASILTLAALVLTACASTDRVAPAQSLVQPVSGFAQGYLPREALPDSFLLLAAPPANNGPAFAADEAAYRSTRALRGSARWDLAVQDAELKFPAAMGTFSCAVNAPITPEATPRLYTLLHRSASDGAFSTSAAKQHYMRLRPFKELNESSCTPHEEAMLAGNGSFPSGHAALGWTWALILAEIAPDRQDAVLSRGYVFGQSRVICGVHWQSDVSEGRVVASGVVARLHADEAFAADLAAARKELAAVRTQGLKPTRDCAAEAAAIAIHK